MKPTITETQQAFNRLRDARRRLAVTAIPCCDWDTDGDGNCPRHPEPASRTEGDPR